MDDILGRIFMIIFSVLLLFVFPLLDTWERHDDIAYMTVYSEVVEFVDAIKNTGFMTPRMLDELEYTLRATGNSYDVQLESRNGYYINNGNAANPSYEVVYEYKFNNQIRKELEALSIADGANAKYRFSQGDYIYVSVRNTNRTLSTIIKEILYATHVPTFKIGVPYGGMIRNNPIAY